MLGSPMGARRVMVMGVPGAKPRSLRRLRTASRASSEIEVMMALSPGVRSESRQTLLGISSSFSEVGSSAGRNSTAKPILTIA